LKLSFLSCHGGKEDSMISWLLRRICLSIFLQGATDR
jgi:hypothetical protein